MSFGADVWVGMMGSKLEAKTMEATGFHKAMLVISWCAWRTSILMIALGVVVEVGSITFIGNLLLYLFINLMEYHEDALPLKDCIEATFAGLRINRKGRLENSSYSLSLKISFSLKNQTLYQSLRCYTFCHLQL